MSCDRCYHAESRQDMNGWSRTYRVMTLTASGNNRTDFIAQEKDLSTASFGNQKRNV